MKVAPRTDVLDLAAFNDRYYNMRCGLLTRTVALAGGPSSLSRVHGCLTPKPIHRRSR